METTGTMLVGSDIAAAATMIQALDVRSWGSTAPPARRKWPTMYAGCRKTGRAKFPCCPMPACRKCMRAMCIFRSAPDEMASWMERFLKEDGINIIGGCCGTNGEHITALNAMLERQQKANVAPRPAAQASLDSGGGVAVRATELRQDNAIFAIGERCNANGSKKFREGRKTRTGTPASTWPKEQVREGSHALDICTAFVGRDEVSDMSEMVSRLRGTVTAPLVIDSTELIVLEAALKLYGGKADHQLDQFRRRRRTGA